MSSHPPHDFIRPTRVRYGVLAFSCSLSLLTYLDRICMMRVKEPIQKDLSLTDTQMGWVFSAFTAGYALCEIPGGWMGDRWGARRVLTRIVLCWSLFTALTGMVWPFSWDFGGALPLVFDSFCLLMLMRFFFGAGEAGAYPNLTRVTRNWFPLHERGLATGGIWMSARLGGAMASLVIGRLSFYLGWRQAFWVLAGAGLAWSVLYYWWYRDRPQEKASCNEAERNLILFGVPTKTDDSEVAHWSGGGHSENVQAHRESIGAETEYARPVLDLPPLEAAASTHDGHHFPPVRKLAGSLTVWAICLVSLCINFGWYFVPTWQPQYYKEVHGISYENSEIVTGLPFLVGAVGCLLGGRLSDFLVRRTGSLRWGRSLLGLVGFTFAGLCVVGMGFTSKPWQAITMLCLANFFNDLAVPVIWAVCADVGGRFVGSIAGLMNMVGGVGAILSPLLIPVVLKLLPPVPAPNGWEPAERWQVIFTGLAGAWFLGAIAWLFVNAGKPIFDEKAHS